jgi:hypothetical protein
MPLYDVEHITPLTDAQQEKLAIAFTDLHSKRFNTPRFFLNVRYTDARAQPVFRAGRKVVYNRVVLRTRVGEQRTKDVYDEHCRDLMRVWGEIIGTEGELGLRTVWVLGALTTAVELGIARPRVSSFSSFDLVLLLWVERLLTWLFRSARKMGGLRSIWTSSDG